MGGASRLARAGANASSSTSIPKRRKNGADRTRIRPHNRVDATSPRSHARYMALGANAREVGRRRHRQAQYLVGFVQRQQAAATRMLMRRISIFTGHADVGFTVSVYGHRCAPEFDMTAVSTAAIRMSLALLAHEYGDARSLDRGCNTGTLFAWTTRSDTSIRPAGVRTARVAGRRKMLGLSFRRRPSRGTVPVRRFLSPLRSSWGGARRGGWCASD